MISIHVISGDFYLILFLARKDSVAYLSGFLFFFFLVGGSVLFVTFTFLFCFVLYSIISEGKLNLTNSTLECIIIVHSL